MILIALGSNLPLKGLLSPDILDRACRALLERDIRILSVSRIWESAPLDHDGQIIVGQPLFYNAVASIETSLSPKSLLERLHEVEELFGRNRGEEVEKNQPRTLDLDLLLFDEHVIEGDGLKLPHPRMAEREFVLYPLRDIDPEWTFFETGEGLSSCIKKISVCQSLRVSDYHFSFMEESFYECAA